MEWRIWIHRAFPDAFIILNPVLDPGPLNEVALADPALTAVTLFGMGPRFNIHVKTNNID